MNSKKFKAMYLKVEFFLKNKAVFFLFIFASINTCLLAMLQSLFVLPLQFQFISEGSSV